MKVIRRLSVGREGEMIRRSLVFSTRTCNRRAVLADVALFATLIANYIRQNFVPRSTRRFASSFILKRRGLEWFLLDGRHAFPKCLRWPFTFTLAFAHVFLIGFLFTTCPRRL